MKKPIPTAEESAALENAVLFSEKVKKFGKTIGIEPTEALSKSSKEQAAASVLWMWSQKMGTISLDGRTDLYTAFLFGKSKEEMKLASIAARTPYDYSVIIRIENEFSGKDAAITPEFAAGSTIEKAMVILHEDMHASLKMNHSTGEAIVTPLGHIAALEFFKHVNDNENMLKEQKMIDFWDKYAMELTDFAGKVKIIFESSAKLEDKRKEALSLLDSYPVYKTLALRQLNIEPRQNLEFAFEAKVTHDLAYYKFFNRIIALYRKIGSAKTLIYEFNQMPKDTEGIKQYLAELEKKYSAATPR